MTMATTTEARPWVTPPAVAREAGRRPWRSPAYQAFLILWVGFTAAPILFGVDKFFDVLVDWQRYLSPEFNDIIPGNAHQAMLAVGVVEIVAGVLVFLLPRVAPCVVAAWLGGIIVNLLLLGDYYDVALRDFGLLLAALALGRLAWAFPHPIFARRS
jgi:hypothetical protein